METRNSSTVPASKMKRSSPPSMKSWSTSALSVNSTMRTPAPVSKL